MPKGADPGSRRSEELEAYVKRVLEARDRLAPRLPDVDPGDLLLILQSLLRPPGWEWRFFLREIRPGVFAP